MDHAEINRLEFRHGKRGEILYRGVGKWRRLPPGTAGQFLQTQGANNDPRWADAPSGGGGGGNLKCYTGSYTGTGSSQTITIPAESTGIKHIEIFCREQGQDSTECYLAIRNDRMGIYCALFGRIAGVDFDFSYPTNELLILGSNTFQVGRDYLSKSGFVYQYTVWYEVGGGGGGS
jgi:hypothetical protein